MTYIKTIKKTIKKIPGIKPLLRYERPGYGTVCMLHRVSPHNPKGLYPNENLKIAPEFLERFIIKKQKKYRFISLDTLAEIIGNAKQVQKKPFICITFDDGYKDNFQYAAPILEKYSVPYAIYVTTCFPDNTAFLWWFLLEDIIKQNSFIELSNGNRFLARTKDEKEEAFISIRAQLLEKAQTDFKNTFFSLLTKYTTHNCNSDAQPLSWEEIRILSSSPLCTIGAHTKNHPPLSKLDEKTALKEIKRGKEELESKIDKPVLHMAYPYGSAAETSEREYGMAKECGFKTATLSYGGNFKRLTGQNLYALPRKFITDL